MGNTNLSVAAIEIACHSDGIRNSSIILNAMNCVYLCLLCVFAAAVGEE